LSSPLFASQWEFPNWCKAWTKNMTIMLSARWKWPTLKPLLVWAFKVLNAWAISSAKMTIVFIFFRSSICNEVNWNNNSSQVPIANEIVPPLPSYTIAGKVCGFSPMCVQTCICCMYDVVHHCSICQEQPSTSEHMCTLSLKENVESPSRRWKTWLHKKLWECPMLHSSQYPWLWVKCSCFITSLMRMGKFLWNF
jgi:hypothetical protein